MIELPAWLFFILQCLCAGIAIIVTLKLIVKKEKTVWYVEIDRISKYWLNRVKRDISESSIDTIPDEIILKINHDKKKK